MNTFKILSMTFTSRSFCSCWQMIVVWSSWEKGFNSPFPFPQIYFGFLLLMVSGPSRSYNRRLPPIQYLSQNTYTSVLYCVFFLNSHSSSTVFLPLCHHKELFSLCCFSVSQWNITIQIFLKQETSFIWRKAQMAWFLSHVSHNFLQPALTPTEHPCLALNTAGGVMCNFLATFTTSFLSWK